MRAEISFVHAEYVIEPHVLSLALDVRYRFGVSIDMIFSRGTQLVLHCSAGNGDNLDAFARATSAASAQPA